MQVSPGRGGVGSLPWGPLLLNLLTMRWLLGGLDSGGLVSAEETTTLWSVTVPGPVSAIFFFVVTWTVDDGGAPASTVSRLELGGSAASLQVPGTRSGSRTGGGRLRSEQRWSRWAG